MNAQIGFTGYQPPRIPMQQYGMPDITTGLNASQNNIPGNAFSGGMMTNPGYLQGEGFQQPGLFSRLGKMLGFGGGAQAGADGPTLMQRIGGYTDVDGTKFNGLGGTALGLGSGLFNAYMGYKQLGLAEDNLDFQKDAFNKNYDSQKKLTNAYLRDRQDMRNRNRPGAEDTDSYMKRNAIA